MAAFVILVLVTMGFSLAVTRSRRRTQISPRTKINVCDSEYIRPLVNKTEAFFLSAVVSTLDKRFSKQLQALPQIPLSQFVLIKDLDLKPRDKARAFSLVCDVVLFNRDWYPVLVIEVNGRGHYQNGWKERDALKANVLRQAGIPLKVIDTDEWPRDLSTVRNRITSELLKLCAVNRQGAQSY